MTLKDLRNENNITAAQVAEQLKISRTTYSGYEQGIRTIDVRLIIPLSKIFGVNAEEIIEAQLSSISIRSSDKIIG